MLCRPPRLSRRRLGVPHRALRRSLPVPDLSQGPPRARVMAHVVMADDGNAIDGATAEAGPLGGAETAFVALAEALAARGHRVEARSNCRAPLCHNGVAWAPLASAVAEECDLYRGNRGHRGGAAKGAEEMERSLARADALSIYGVRRHAPVGREMLALVLAGARVMLYRGDPGETFCLALAEAQAMGVPAVVQPRGSVVERVIDGVTGHIAGDDDSFAAAAIALLRDDDLWRRYHAEALARQRGQSWDEVAAQFEALI